MSTANEQEGGVLRRALTLVLGDRQQVRQVAGWAGRRGHPSSMAARLLSCILSPTG